MCGVHCVETRSLSLSHLQNHLRTPAPDTTDVEGWLEYISHLTKLVTPKPGLSLPPSSIESGE